MKFPLKNLLVKKKKKTYLASKLHVPRFCLDTALSAYGPPSTISSPPPSPCSPSYQEMESQKHLLGEPKAPDPVRGRLDCGGRISRSQSSHLSITDTYLDQLHPKASRGNLVTPRGGVFMLYTVQPPLT